MNIHHHSWQTHDLMMWLLRIALLCCAWLALASVAGAQSATGAVSPVSTENSSPMAGDSASQAPQGEPVKKTLDIHSVPKLNLGHFEIQNLEPARALTAKIAFELHLTLPEGISAVDLAELQRWKHRLREQVLVAVRVSDIVDFLDPDLDRFRRHLLYRVNRLIRPIQAQNVLLADFTFSAS